MFWDDKKEQRDQVVNDYGYDQPPEEHKGKLSHELLAGAASFEGFKLWEDHQINEGKPVKHKFAKELLAGFVGGEAEKLVESHALNKRDADQAKERAVMDSEKMYDEHYGQNGGDDFDPSYGRHQGQEGYDQGRYNQ